jgi:hypothetical protein
LQAQSPEFKPQFCKKKKKKNQCAQAVKEAEAGKPIGKGGEEAIAQRPGG